MVDAINSPEHYRQGGMETIDVIQAKLSEEEFRGYLLGNIIKYITRWQHKGRPVEDLGKASWYLERLRGEVEPPAPMDDAQWCCWEKTGQVWIPIPDGCLVVDEDRLCRKDETGLWVPVEGSDETVLT